MKKRTPLLAITILALLVTTATANHQLERLRMDYKNQCRQLRYERDLAIKQARAEHRLAMDRFNCALRDARHLCEPARSAAIHQIHCQRRAAVRAFQDRLAGIRASYAVVKRQAKAAYELACSQVRVALLPCGCPINHCTCPPPPPVVEPCLTPVLPPRPVGTWGTVRPVTLLTPETIRWTTTRRVVVPRTDPAAAYHDGTYRVGHHPVAHMLKSLLAHL